MDKDSQSSRKFQSSKAERRREKKVHKEKKKLKEQMLVAERKQARKEKLRAQIRKDVEAELKTQNISRGQHMVELSRKKVTERRQVLVPSSSRTTTKADEVPLCELTPLKTENLIGSGSFGNCFKSFWRGNIPVIVKKIKSQNHHELQHEANVLGQLRHPNIPILLGVNYTEHFLVMQLCGLLKTGRMEPVTLHDALTTGCFSKSATAWKMFTEQIVSTVDFVHS